MSVYVTRVLFPELIGQVEYARNFSSYFLTLAMLGLPSYGIKEISKKRHQPDELKTTFSELLIINFITTFISFVLYTLIHLIIKTDIENGLYFIFGLSIFLNIFNIDWFYKGMEDYPFIITRSIIVQFISFILLFLFVKQTSDYLAYATISVFSTSINHVLNIYHSRKYINFCIKGLKIKKHISILLTLAISIFFSNIYHKIDITMLGKLGTNESVAFYTYAQKIIAAVTAICTMPSMALYPRLSYYYLYDQKKFYKLLNSGLNMIIFLSFPLSVGLFLLAPEGIALFFGNTFLPAAKTIRILSPLVLIMTFGNLLSYQMILCTGNEKKRLPAYFLGTIGNIFLNTIMIPSFMENGAAAASVIAELVVNGVQIYFIKKIVHFHIDIQALFQAIISSIVMGCMILLIKQLFTSLFFSIIISFIVGISIYFFTNYYLGNKLIQNFIEKVICKKNKEG